MYKSYRYAHTSLMTIYTRYDIEKNNLALLS